MVSGYGDVPVVRSAKPPEVSTAGPPPDPYKAGIRWCAVVSYFDGSGIRAVYGPYKGKTAAEDHAKALKDAGVWPDDQWAFLPLRLIDTGTRNPQ